MKATFVSHPWMGIFFFVFVSGVHAGQSDELERIRKQVIELEQGLLAGNHTPQNARLQLNKIQKLLKLQQKEKELGQKRVVELEDTVVALEARQAALKEKLLVQQKEIKKSLTAIESSSRRDFSERFHSLKMPDQETLEAPRRRALANLVDRGLKEVEILRVDLADATQLEGRIQEEKQKLAYLFQDLKEQESVLELNRQLQLDILRRKPRDRILRLEKYRKLKTAEAQVENLMGDFSARKELEKATKGDSDVSKVMAQAEFFKLRGKLRFPVANSKVTSTFGRVFDPQSGLHVFKKGVDLAVGKKEPVLAIAPGKVAYSGEMPQYGQVVILDHGNHFYSLCAHLGKVSKKTHESVKEGDTIGVTADSGAPLYFEIRARNVAVNPLQWVFN